MTSEHTQGAPLFFICRRGFVGRQAIGHSLVAICKRAQHFSCFAIGCLSSLPKAAFCKFQIGLPALGVRWVGHDKSLVHRGVQLPVGQLQASLSAIPYAVNHSTMSSFRSKQIEIRQIAL